jgi:hypothetical protein
MKRQHEEVSDNQAVAVVAVVLPVNNTPTTQGNNNAHDNTKNLIISIKKPTIQTIPLDMALTIGKLLNNKDPYKCYTTDISQITLAAIIGDKEMLTHLLDRCPVKEAVVAHVAVADNINILKWVIDQNTYPMTQGTCCVVAKSGKTSQELNIIVLMCGVLPQWVKF